MSKIHEGGPGDDRRSPGQVTAAEMTADCGYHENPEDGETDGGTEALIEYKNACRDRMVSMIDAREVAIEHFLDASSTKFRGLEVAQILREETPTRAYTVACTYPDGSGRLARVFEETDPERAERAARAWAQAEGYGAILVAAVIEGAPKVVL